MRWKLMGGLLACLAMLPSVASAAIYSQPAVTTGSVGWAGSQYDTGPITAGQRRLFDVAFENFSVATTQTITGLSWAGAYQDVISGSPTTGLVSGFTISIYNSVGGGQPPAYGIISNDSWFATASNPFLSGAGFVSQFIAGTANESALAFTPGGTQLLSYSAGISAFTAQAGQEYWVSIVAHLDTDVAYWGWTEGSGGDGNAYQDYETANLGMDRQLTGFDLAFTAVPEPSSVIICVGLVGGAVAGGVARRRKAKAAAKSVTAA